MIQDQDMDFDQDQDPDDDSVSKDAYHLVSMFRLKFFIQNYLWSL